MCNLVQVEKIIYFECPYCGKPHNLTRLLGTKEITQTTSIFVCYARWGETKIEGCNKKFVLDLTLCYKVEVEAIEGERERENE